MPSRFLITCATGDIGRELCLYLAKNGHDLIITARNIERLELLANEIKKDSPDCNVQICSADLSDNNTMHALIQLCKEVKIDGVVFMPPRPLPLSINSNMQTKELDKQQAKIDCCYNPRILLEALLPSIENSMLKSVVLMSGISSVKPSTNPQYETFNVVRAEWNNVMETLVKNYRSITFTMVSPDQVNTRKYQQKTNPSVSVNNITEVSDVIEVIYSRLKCATWLNGTNTILENRIACIHEKKRNWCEFFAEISCFTSCISTEENKQALIAEFNDSDPSLGLCFK